MSTNNELKELIKSNETAAWLNERAKLALKEAGINEKKNSAPEPNKDAAAAEAKKEKEKEKKKKKKLADELDPFDAQVAVIDNARTALGLPPLPPFRRG